MDPLACLQCLLEDILDGDIDGAREKAQDFSRWLSTGGFLPEASGVADLMEALLGNYHNRTRAPAGPR